MSKEKFSAILIDWSALAKQQYDFLGLKSVALPTLYNLLQQSGVQLLDTNVLHQKVIQGLSDSVIVKEIDKLYGCCSGLNLLKAVSEEARNAVSTLETINLPAQFAERFEELYANALTLPNANANDVITQYYAKLPPYDDTYDDFSIADAFAVAALRDYATANMDKNVLVVTNSWDWNKALCNLPNVTIQRTVEEALEQFTQRSNTARQMYKRFVQQVNVRIKEMFNDFSYVLEFDSTDGIKPTFYADNFYLDATDVYVLSVTDNKAIYRVFANVTINGKSRTSRCPYHHEDDYEYDYDEAIVNIPFEVTITFKKGEMLDTAKLAQVTLAHCGSIEVTPIIDD